MKSDYCSAVTTLRRIEYIAVIVLSILTACQEKSDETNIRLKKIEFQVQNLSIKENPDCNSLMSYSLSSYCRQDNCIYSYNYKTHAVDLIDLTSDSVCHSIKLFNDGPDAIMRDLHALKVISPDTIVTYDLLAIKIIDSNGHITSKINLPNEYICRIDCNSRSNISDFQIDFNRKTIIYPVMNSDENELIEYDFSSNQVINKYRLNGPSNTGEYGFMKYPNVSFYEDKVIYNYPFESNIFVLDTKNNTTQKLLPQSSFTDTKMPTCKSNSIDELCWYGTETFFNSPLYYLKGLNQFVRVTLGATKSDRSQNIDIAYNDKPFYITVFDSQFTPVGEFEIAQRTYNPFGGWCPLNDNIAFFKDNVLDEQSFDNICLDLILPGTQPD